MPTQNQNQPIHFLHLSDIHFTAGKAWDADPILRALARFIAQEVKGGLIPDLVAITGDLAFAATADEYRLARDWLDNQLWPALPDGFPRDRLLLVPGNHDVDRRCVVQGVRHIQDGLLATSSQDAIAGLLKDDGEREVALKRHAAYLDFHGDWLGEVQPLPWWRRIEIDGTDLHVAGLDSAWLAWRLAAVVAEAIIASPRVGPESLDAHLVRGGVRLLGIGAVAALLAFGANTVGLPLYGILAGLGVGGLAVALAAQPTIENLIAGISLVADKAVRIGELCQYGDALGTVEAVGVRSTRIRGHDRTLTNIPNAVLAKMPIISLTRRDQMLIRTVLGLRYETTPEQLRTVLVNLRNLLKGDPQVETARARLVKFGDSSLDIEVWAYVRTADWVEFLGIREDLLLRMLDIIEQGGTALAFPSQTLYLGRDRGNDPIKVSASEERVQEWRGQGSLGEASMGTTT